MRNKKYVQENTQKEWKERKTKTKILGDSKTTVMI